MSFLKKIIKWTAIAIGGLLALILALGLIGNSEKNQSAHEAITFSEKAEACHKFFSALRKDKNIQSPEEIECWQKVEQERSRASLSLQMKCNEEVSKVKKECATAGNLDQCMMIKMPDYGFRCAGIIAK
jgi:hypothetical protein